jgi:hypothetical protein
LINYFLFYTNILKMFNWLLTQREKDWVCLIGIKLRVNPMMKMMIKLINR